MFRTAFPFLLLAAPAFADAPDCGGIGVAGTWIGGGEAASDLTSRDFPIDLVARPPMVGHMVHLFSVSEPTEVRIEASTLGQESDPTLTIYAADGTLMGGNDDFHSDTLDSRIDILLEPGAYCVTTRERFATSIDLSMRFGRDVQLPLVDHGSVVVIDPSDDPQAVDAAQQDASCERPALTDLPEPRFDIADLTEGAARTASVDEGPVWRFELTEAMPVTITATMADGDPRIRLLDATGRVIGENDDFDGYNAQIELTDPLAPGRYCIEVEEVFDNNDRPVTLGLGLYDPSIERQRNLNRASFAPTDADDVEITSLGPVDTTLIQDVAADAAAARWMEIDMPQDGLLMIEAIGQGVDPALTLFDRAGRRIAENDDGPGDGYDSQIALRLRPGRYLLAVTAVAENTAGNVRLVLERYVPAQ